MWSLYRNRIELVWKQRGTGITKVVESTNQYLTTGNVLRIKFLLVFLVLRRKKMELSTGSYQRKEGLK